MITKDDYIITFVVEIETAAGSSKKIRNETVHIITTDSESLNGAWERAFAKALDLGPDYMPYVLKGLKLSQSDTELA